MSWKQRLKNIIEFFGLGQWTDRLRFYYQYLRNRKKINAFRKENTDIPLPEPFMIYETFKLDYQRYLDAGKEDARWIYEESGPFIDLKNKIVLDWGCGPGRIIRHFPAIEPTAKFFGCDYNKAYVNWNQKNLKGISFAENNLLPPLPYTESSFDFAYAISIFTHLSEENHYLWIEELHRVLKPGGIFFFTTHGDITKKNLLEKERVQYDEGSLVVRGNVKEGNRMYTAYHPAPFMQDLLSSRFRILKHRQGEVKDWGLEQDVWIIQKK